MSNPPDRLVWKSVIALLLIALGSDNKGFTIANDNRKPRHDEKASDLQREVAEYFGLYEQQPDSHSEMPNADDCRQDGATLTDEMILLKHLLQNYSSLTRPVEHANESLSVVARIYPIKLLDLIERDQVMQMIVRFQLGWKDNCLTWNPSEFGNLTSLILPGDSLWIPDIQIGNSANDRYGLLRNRQFPFKLHDDGEIWFHPTGGVQTRCQLDLLWFPFDIQRCPLVLESAMHPQSAVNLTVRPGKQAIVMSMYTENSLWDLVEASGTSYYYRSSSAASARIFPLNSYSVKLENNFTRVVFWLKFRRKVSYYKLNVIYPCFMLTTMQLLTFFLPLNSLTRVPQATTILLSVIIFQGTVVDQLPKTSDSITILGIYTMLMIIVSVAAIMESVFVANVLRRNFGPIKIPSHIAFILRIFLKSDPDGASPTSTKSSRKDSVPHVQSTSSLPPLVPPSRNPAQLESVREESEHGGSSSPDEGPRPAFRLLNVASLLRHRQSSQTSGSGVFAFPTPRNSSTNADAETASNIEREDERIRDHLSNLWRSATGKQPLVSVVVDWQRIAVVINTTTFSLCTLLVVVIPGVLMYAIPDE